MIFAKRASFAMLGLVLMILVSACGGTTTPASTTTTTAPTPTPAPATVKTAQATVNGKSETILTNAQGMTLYIYTPDTVSSTACTGGCATAWPPLTSTAAPTSATTLPGKLTTLSDANGSQVEYAGFLLYTFASDKAPGDVKGEGIGSKWYVATPDLASISIRVSVATVAGKSETILANAQGMTLYFYLPDTVQKTFCTGGCATAWPPLLATATGSTPTASAPLVGTIGVAADANGNQIQYQGHMLYTFASDKAPGDTTGQGVGGKWFVVTPDVHNML
jgi:predicted lipoprotein with Yx(FWY)xxD motif